MDKINKQPRRNKKLLTPFTNKLATLNRINTSTDFGGL